MDLGLKGKVAIITGGSEGIGKAAAARLAQEGASVVICARRKDVLQQAADDLKKQTGGKVLPVPGDVSKATDIHRIVDETVKAFGRIDIVVNNAGTSAAGPFESIDDQAWSDDLDLKLMAAVRFARAALPHMRKAGGGRIINVTNIGGKAPTAASVPTSVSRAAGIALTKALSKDLAKDNILVNTVCIGVIKSGQQERRFREMQKKDPSLTIDNFYTQQAKQRGVPLGRVGEASEAGDVIAFLASDRASYLTGTSINIDGGSSSVV
jgi:NAD(P)-dependent dehydrogenase (short-subunit alcohol dehydrogenase family)